MKKEKIIQVESLPKIYDSTAVKGITFDVLRNFGF
jgi:hypothetical protein